MSKYIKDLTFTATMRNGLIEVSSGTPEVACLAEALITPSTTTEEDLITNMPFSLDVEMIDDEQARIHLTIDATDIMDVDGDRIKDLLQESYDEGYREGEEAGSDASYDSGYSSGYSDGQDEGEETGRRDGYNEAEEEYQEKMAEMKDTHEEELEKLKDQIAVLIDALRTELDKYDDLLTKYNNLQPY